MIERYQTPEMRALWSEARKYQVWAEVEILVMEAWESLGQVPIGTAQQLRQALQQKPLDASFARRVEEIEAETRHDIVAFTRALTEWVGSLEVARWLHLGLTSTDVVDTAQNLLLDEALGLIEQELDKVLAALKHLAVRYKHLPAVGRTHGVHAEPTSFGLRFLAFYAALLRDRERLNRAREGIRVAMISGSVGNYAHVEPAVEAWVAQKLGFQIEPASSQVVPRDRHAELMGALAILGADLERIAVELRHLQRTEVLEAQEPFSYKQTGSSSMPHKKNPVALENISGLARLLRSNLQAELENVALWHERDISHSSVERVILPDTTTLAHYMLRRLLRVLEGLVVFEENIQRNLERTRGLVYSQRVLSLLIEAGLDRTAAYEIVQRNALKSWAEGQDFRALLEADPACPLKGAALAQAFDPGYFLRHVDTIYARFGL
ncbi:adenylosuccinate lyase [Meiothermus taiwanensis]|jgi:adenylosuccinate lyase|uniref:Adenylosuccinate lyase n=2 Tax=Meiothermus taiwanensis TaxID=172827 RepID=A0A399DTS7_9DEIN|nr:adenylosuccinate lyase [Meiothermus taiwanensis]AWR86018.1 adenylosuccinate lyase [Meiothermus taiwanensis WR-220]KIQ55236.1 adenylosuccinate lyase [Meiothermus taiwanensis]KZK15513.1 adenylosuccinate lyase [Meiothermus taiwanensis]RIH75654.1 Adenylosuccinate lyase [Meiothermus taiwanensis]